MATSAPTSATDTVPVTVVSQKKVRDALLALADGLPGTDGMFGTKEEVDPIRHLIGAAFGWCANPPKDAIYLNIVPKFNDGKAVYRLTVKDVPVDGFWSVSVYNAKASTSRTSRTHTRSTTRRPRRARTGRSPSSSADAATARPTAYRSPRAGTTWSGSIARARQFSTARGSFPRLSPWAEM